MKILKQTEAPVLTLIVYDEQTTMPIAQVCADGEITFYKSGLYREMIEQILALSINFNIIYNSL